MSKKEILFYRRDREKYPFLSNFWLSPIVINGEEYKTVEHYYQSQKARYEKDRLFIKGQVTPGKAKREGRKIALRKDWEKGHKDVAMMNGLRAKFTQNPELKKKLLATGDTVLHEDSPSDKYFGSIVGKDKLGKMLMRIRNDLRR